jgi:hypothetical protein
VEEVRGLIKKRSGPYRHVIGIIEDDGRNLDLLDKEVGIIGKGLTEQFHTWLVKPPP